MSPYIPLRPLVTPGKGPESGHFVNGGQRGEQVSHGSLWFLNYNRVA